jgi:hypothetical protein
MAYDKNEKRASAGRVLIVPRGEWKSDVTYNMLDLVNHNGYAFLAKTTVVGIEPNDDNFKYWHNMLDINKIVKEAITNTFADEVGDMLQERFADMLSEAKYVEDLFGDFAEPTFVRWDVNTKNTPYTAGLTIYPNGYALVSGAFTANHTASAWIGNENYTHGVIAGNATGWTKTISSAGGIMSAPLGLGDGKGTVLADDTGTYLEAIKDEENKRVIKIENPEGEALEDAVKFEVTEGGKKEKFNLFGEHNPDLPMELGYAKIEHFSYIGTGIYGPNNPTKYTCKFTPKIIILGKYIMIRGNSGASYSQQGDTDIIHITWQGKTTEWYANLGTGAEDQMNAKGKEYNGIAIG